MKFSLDNAQKYSQIEFKKFDHSEIVQKMGLQLGAIEEFNYWGDLYKNIVVVKIIEFYKHPDADNLTVCKIDDGGVTANVERDNNNLVQVVCGAPNVKGGLFVVWIPPGAVVPSTANNEPFVLETREIRGQKSNGMLASPKELNISDDHEGILVIPGSASSDAEPKVGTELTQYFGLDDFIVTCENKMFTHRPDCFGNLGIAREVAGIFGKKFESPDWYKNTPDFVEAGHVSIESKVDISELVPRFTVVAMNNVSVKPSPIWLQAYLKRIGIKPINNIVDITNYVMHVTGQPLHAFDVDKLVKKSSSVASKENISIHPRMARDGEELLLLGNKKVTLSKEDIVIATDEQAVALAGVMGGAETEVDLGTTSIIIECANFDMYAIRRTSMRHGLFTEAVTRFNKGQSPLQNDRVLAYAMQLMSEHAAAMQASRVVDVTSFDLQADNLSYVETTSEFINSRLGTQLSDNEIKTLLENVEFSVELSDESLLITVPFWRMDIAIAEDIVEEVGRLHGYENVPVVLPKRIAKPTPKNEKRVFKQAIRDKMLLLGANEIFTYSFVHGKLLEHIGLHPDEWAYHLRNALSPDLQYYRPLLMTSVLSKVRLNLKAQAGDEQNQFVLYELGKVHVKNEYEQDEADLPKQMNRLAIVVAADEKTARKYGDNAYYHVKQYVDTLTNNQATYKELDNFSYPITAPYAKGRSAEVWVGDVLLGVIGEFNSKLKNKLKLPKYAAGSELDIDLLRQQNLVDTYKVLSSYPSTDQDITFEMDEKRTYYELTSFLEAEAAVSAAEENLQIQIRPISIYKAQDTKKVRVSYRITFTHNQKTMTTEEVNKLLEHFAETVHEKIHATRI